MKRNLTNEERSALIERFEHCRDEAIALYSTSIERDPEFQLGHRELGWAYRRQGDIEKAEVHLRRALELDPADGWAHIFFGNLLWGKFEYDAAEAAFQTAVAVWSDSSIPHWCLGIYYEYEKGQHQAGQCYRRALEIDPNDPVALFRYGQLLRAQHRFAKAIRIFKRLLEIDPTNERANSGLFEATLSMRLRRV